MRPDDLARRLIELMPALELYVGLQLIREEECQRCHQHTSHLFECRSVTPRFWAYRCLECSPKRKP